MLLFCQPEPGHEEGPMAAALSNWRLPRDLEGPGSPGSRAIEQHLREAAEKLPRREDSDSQTASTDSGFQSLSSSSVGSSGPVCSIISLGESTSTVSTGRSMCTSTSSVSTGFSVLTGTGPSTAVAASTQSRPSAQERIAVAWKKRPPSPGRGSSTEVEQRPTASAAAETAGSEMRSAAATAPIKTEVEVSAEPRPAASASPKKAATSPRKMVQGMTGRLMRSKSADPRRQRSSTITSRNPEHDVGATSARAAPAVAEASVTCDKCDGPHATGKCPHFRKGRSKHADAWSAYGRSKSAPPAVDSRPLPIVKIARVVPQPGDGSCLFHSLSFGLQDNSNAQQLRRDISAYIAKHPSLKIADTSIKDWVKYDSGGNVKAYANKMKGGTWGGGIEMAAFTKMKNANVHVYEKCKEGFKRISAFESPGAEKTVNVLYCGRMHYDALVVTL